MGLQHPLSLSRIPTSAFIVVVVWAGSVRFNPGRGSSHAHFPTSGLRHHDGSVPTRKEIACRLWSPGIAYKTGKTLKLMFFHLYLLFSFKKLSLYPYANTYML